MKKKCPRDAMRQAPVKKRPAGEIAKVRKQLKKESCAVSDSSLEALRELEVIEDNPSK
jgi:hypothetical protein